MREANVIVDVTLRPMYLGPQFTRALKKDNTTRRQPIIILDLDTVSIYEESVWDDDRSIVGLRKFYALRDMAVSEYSQGEQDGHSVLHFSLQCKFYFRQSCSSS
jgi:hypothetical protein